MFYFLIILGILLMAVGIYKEKDNLFVKFNEKQEKVEFNELYHLNKRIENIEKILFFSDDSDDFEKVWEEAVGEGFHPLPTPQNSLEKYERILQYEKEDYSLEEICSILDMKKGEVLLLKNLYKTYKK